MLKFNSMTIMVTNLVDGIDDPYYGGPISNKMELFTDNAKTIGGGTYNFIFVICIISALICLIICGIMKIVNSNGRMQSDMKEKVGNILFGISLLCSFSSILIKIYLATKGLP